MKFTDAQKKVIVARHENGESVRSLCSEFNIPRSTFYRWCKSHKTNTIANGIPFTAREINQMQNRIVMCDSRSIFSQGRCLYNFQEKQHPPCDLNLQTSYYRAWPFPQPRFSQ